MDKLNLFIEEILKTLEESPIGNFSLEGDWKQTNKSGGNYDKQSVGILTSPVAEKKFKNFFKNTDYDFNVYFLKMKNSRDFMELGKVSEEFVNDKLGWKEYQHDEDALNVIFTNNIGAERMPMTPWTAAHRISHALASSAVRGNNNSSVPYLFKEIVKSLTETINVYFEFYGLRSSAVWKGTYIDFGYPDKLVGRVLSQIGTFRSARLNKIARPMEFVHEMFAQYINSGEVTFNEDPQPVKYDRSVYKFNKEAFNDDYSAGYWSRTFDYQFHDLLGASVGDILVM